MDPIIYFGIGWLLGLWSVLVYAKQQAKRPNLKDVTVPAFFLMLIAWPLALPFFLADLTTFNKS